MVEGLVLVVTPSLASNRLYFRERILGITVNNHNRISAAFRRHFLMACGEYGCGLKTRPPSCVTPLMSSRCPLFTTFVPAEGISFGCLRVVLGQRCHSFQDYACPAAYLLIILLSFFLIFYNPLRYHFDHIQFLKLREEGQSLPHSPNSARDNLGALRCPV